MYNFDYRTTTYTEYRGTLEWYYSPAIGFGGKTADEYLDWLYDYYIDIKLIQEVYTVTDKSLVYQSPHGDLVVPVTIYFKVTNTDNPGYTDELNKWYKYDAELTFIGLAETREQIDMWEHSFWKISGEDELSNANMEAGE
jgi:hypothetical protein